MKLNQMRLFALGSLIMSGCAASGIWSRMASSTLLSHA